MGTSPMPRPLTSEDYYCLQSGLNAIIPTCYIVLDYTTYMFLKIYIYKSKEKRTVGRLGRRWEDEIVQSRFF
jgi:hypothetical protein